MKINLTIPILPISYKRPRLSPASSGRPHVHNDPKYLRYRYDLQLLIKSELIRQNIIVDDYFKKPVAIKAEFYFQASKKNDTGAKHVYKPDLDNLMKALIDAGSGLLFHDDDSVYSIQCTKHYGADNSIKVEISYE